jgi:hypothetical protein
LYDERKPAHKEVIESDGHYVWIAVKAPKRKRSDHPEGVSKRSVRRWEDVH